jgi:ubiquinol-cytochrome c reductase cytochrome c1 subunit
MQAVRSTIPVAAAAVVSYGGLSKCNDDHIPSLDIGWSHEGPVSSFDAKAVRRGYQVYKEVCASCHSLERIAFRNLSEYGAWSEAEVKAMAADEDVVDGPDDQGEMFDRPGKASDMFPSPYANEEAGRAANNGAYPPDLSLMVKARHGGVNYIFALLTGYCDPPAGKEILPGLHYNPYFSGSAIGMPPPLMDGAVTYPDGTEATVSQMAKDVSCFLAWAAEPEHDDRKKMGMKIITALGIATAITGFMKRHRWAPLKTRQISYIN